MSQGTAQFSSSATPIGIGIVIAWPLCAAAFYPGQLWLGCLGVAIFVFVSSLGVMVQKSTRASTRAAYLLTHRTWMLAWMGPIVLFGISGGYLRQLGYLETPGAMLGLAYLCVAPLVFLSLLTVRKLVLDADAVKIFAWRFSHWKFVRRLDLVNSQDRNWLHSERNSVLFANSIYAILENYPASSGAGGTVENA